MNPNKYLSLALTLCFYFTFIQAAAILTEGNEAIPSWRINSNEKGSSFGIRPEDQGNESDPGERLLSFLKNFEDLQIPEGPVTSRLLGLRDALMDIHDRLQRIENETNFDLARFSLHVESSTEGPEVKTLPSTESITLAPDTQTTTPAKEQDNGDKLNPLAPVLTDIRDILQEQVKNNKITEDLKSHVEQLQQENLDLKQQLENGLEQLRTENLANMLKERAERLKIEEQLKMLQENPVSGIRNQLSSGLQKTFLG